MIKPKLGPLARREQRLALGLLLPTVLIVLSIVLFPLLATFWISFKPVTLADLRPPEIFVRERTRGLKNIQAAGDSFRLEYRLSWKTPYLEDLRSQTWTPDVNWLDVNYAVSWGTGSQHKMKNYALKHRLRRGGLLRERILVRLNQPLPARVPTSC